MHIEQLIQAILDCEKSFINPNGLKEISLEIITPGKESNYSDLKLIRTLKLREKFESLPEQLQADLYMLYGTFQYYTWEDETTRNLANWFTMIVVPGEYETWESREI